jgi:hypothetical protein
LVQSSHRGVDLTMLERGPRFRQDPFDRRRSTPFFTLHLLASTLFFSAATGLFRSNALLLG